MYASFECKRLTTNFDFTNLTCNLGRGTVSDMVLNFNANAAAILPPAESPKEKKQYHMLILCQVFMVDTLGTEECNVLTGERLLLTKSFTEH